MVLSVIEERSRTLKHQTLCPPDSECTFYRELIISNLSSNQKYVNSIHIEDFIATVDVV